MTRICALLVVAVVACGQDRQQRVAQPSVPTRVRVLTDAQFTNAVRDLIGFDPPPIHTPGSTPHQFIHDDVIALDGAQLVEYRVAAEAVGQQVALIPSCADLTCALDLAERAFRRPLTTDERDELAGLFARGGYPLVVEAVLQAPSFLYRSELGASDDARSVDLDAYELAAELGFFFYDSLPDAELRAAAADGSLLDPTVLARHVDRLLADPRVRDHLLQVVLEWLQARRILDVTKDSQLFPELVPPLRASMYQETERFVRAVLFERNGSLRELLTSRATFVDERLALHYGITTVTGDAFVPVTLDATQRAGILTQANLMTTLAASNRESIILRAKYVHDTFLCTPDMGRPPFDAIAAVSSFTNKLSESQFGYYRVANTYCATCHRTLDPPGRALEHYDAIGRYRYYDELGLTVDDEASIEIDGALHDLRGGVQLGELLANSPQVARCTVQRFAQHAFGQKLAAQAVDALTERFEDSDLDLVDLFRAIATSRSFRERWRGDL